MINNSILDKLKYGYIYQMNTPNKIKTIIYETIQKYINDKFTSNASLHFKAPEQIEEYCYEFRTGDNLINIAKLCLDDQRSFNTGNGE